MKKVISFIFWVSVFTIIYLYRNQITTFVVDNYSGEVTLNMAIIWRKVFNYLGMSNSEFIKEIDDNVVCN